jgi:GTP-binding protein
MHYSEVRIVIIKDCNFIISAVSPDQYPESHLPEIAFVGRSNVGKSSLINSLLKRKKLVKVSSNPGKTRTINFFTVNNEIMLVDLPGYGYAAVSKEEKIRWADMIETYLIKRKNLKSVVLLVDIRHKPTSDDEIMFDFIKHYNKSVIVIATKLDKISKNIIQKNTILIKDTLEMDDNDIFIPYSSVNHIGRDLLWDEILLKI